MKLKYLVIILALIVFVIGCGTQESNISQETGIQGSQETNEEVSGNSDIVLLKNNGFMPDVLEVTRGTEVTWENMNETSRIFGIENEEIKSDELEKGEMYSFVFLEQGDFAIRDLVGHEMTVSVE